LKKIYNLCGAVKRFLNIGDRMTLKFDKHYRRYIQSFLLVLPMTGIVTAVNTIVAKGMVAVLTAATMRRWGISLLVAFPIVLFIAPLASKLTDHLIKTDLR
jgi:hypothetical protein